MTREIPVTFECHAHTLVGIVHQPLQVESDLGVLIIVGGPQTRVGSHRQFVLLARFLARHGIPVMRFDYRAMGDAGGENVDFESISEDINAALNTFQQTIPGVKRFLLWGLCDAASAALFYAYQDNRVEGLALLNPWVRTEAGQAKTYLKHYYAKRLLDPEFWQKIIRGKLNIKDSAGSLIKTLKSMLSSRQGAGITSADAGVAAKGIDKNLPLPERMRQGLELFQGQVLLILSGNNDFVADEFKDVVKQSQRWAELLSASRVILKDFPQANHTFSSAQWRAQVEQWTLDWVNGQV